MTDFSELVQGYHRFRKQGWEGQRERWSELTEGQSPKVMVIACSDSRVDPAIIFDSDPGEIFVVRNVAALVPPFETTPGRHGVSAALEFAVQFLQVPEILVLGHGRCGGCEAALTAAMKNAPRGQGGFVADWIEMLDEARERIVAAHGDHGRPALRAMEQEAVRVSLANLRTFPCIIDKEASGDVRLHGAHFAIADGILYVLDEETDRFEPAA
ncbi:carbonic anhydrase [Novosphingopyxis sp.]|uniref:carbonic anhydrase n=1 Tax=Novosphingopyxis sp. TaxID=2709690 RepID=UPI003B5B9075